MKRTPSGDAVRPRVEFNWSDSIVTITGRMLAGSSSCDRAVLQRAAFDRTEERLRVVVGTGLQGSWWEFLLGRQYLLDLSADWYRARIQMVNDLPGTVVVVERGFEETTRWTINRSEET